MGVTMRRGTDPFNEKIRARIFTNTSTASYISTSGSEHDAESDVVSPSSSSTTSSSSSSSPPSSSLCLSHLVQNFLEDDSDVTREFDVDSDSDESGNSDVTPLIANVINPIVRTNADPYRTALLSHVARAVEMFSVFRKDRSIFSRNLMSYLRELGYNAGVCKTRWPSSGSLTAGSYEFIDVLSPASVRYVVDADFAGEFELARETESYAVLRSALPRVFVGKCQDVKRIVRVVCEEAKRAMKSKGLSLPPWRKGRYMQAKWLGPYRRTTNHSPAMEISPASFGVKCRAVGFDPAGECRRMYVAPATRTR